MNPRFPIMKFFPILLLVLSVWSLPLRAEWRIAEAGYEYSFPGDHYAHRDFKTEWWYFTGHLAAKDGREFGYQLTFFRQGVIDPGSKLETSSRFVRPDIYFAHFALSDRDGKMFHFRQKLSRGAFGEAGDNVDPAEKRMAWIGDWELQRRDGGFHFRAAMEDAALDLNLVPTKRPVINGKGGISQKSAGPGNASHYYSITRLRSEGTLTLRGEKLAVTGESWFDREWGSSQLGGEQVGWDWFSIQMEDGSDLMIYRLRREDGSTDAFSGGTLVAPDGSSETLAAEDFTVTPGSTWKSEKTGAEYPLEWSVALPARGLRLQVKAALKDQELAFEPVSYWEGVIEIEGTREGEVVRGRGYLEMTGYAGAMDVLR